MDIDSQQQLLTIDYQIWIRGVFLLILLCCSALVSGAEVAFFSISKKELDNISVKSKTQQLVEKLIIKPQKLLATILIANNFINILIVLVFAGLSEFLFTSFTGVVKFLMEVVLVTFLILLFGEVLPKVYANRKPIVFSLFMARPIYFLSYVFIPLSSPLRSLTSVIERKLGNKNNNISVEKLSEVLELTSESETTKEEKKILEGIVTFGNTKTVQIMKPRTDVCAISDQESYQEVLKIILKNGYSRNPVYHESIDNVIGVLYAKDLLKYLNKQTFDWVKLIRKPFVVPENKKLDDLLTDFKERKNHMAIVVDEYGGTSGIVTLEDVIEEIVGDINDEFDDDDLSYSKIDANTYVFDGKTTIKDFCRVFDDDEVNFEQEKGESETVAGLILEVYGKFPKKGEEIKFKNYSFVIESLDRKRIKQIKIIRNV